MLVRVQQPVQYAGILDWFENLFGGGSKPKATKQGEQQQGQKSQSISQSNVSHHHIDINKILLIGGGLLVAYLLLKSGKTEKQLKTTA